jgi:hypothetical protein
MAITITTDFYGSPVMGSTPISATFNAIINFSPPQQTNYQVSAYNWCFDYKGDSSDVWETTSEPTIIHIFYGRYAQSFKIALIVETEEIQSGNSLTGSLSATKEDYVILGGVDPVRNTQNRMINIVNFLPNSFVGSDTHLFTSFFEDYLNSMFGSQVIESFQESSYVPVNTIEEIIELEDTLELEDTVEI